MKSIRFALLSIITLSAALFLNVAADAQESKKKSKSLKISILIRGAHCDEDVTVFRSALKKMKGIKLKTDEITPGEKPKYFSEPFVVEIKDKEKTNVGALALTISKAKTPHRKEFPPKVNLVLYTPDVIDEPAVMALRTELMNVNGVEVVQPGGLGGFPNKGYYWVQLEDVGGADLNEILKAVEKASVKVTLVKT